LKKTLQNLLDSQEQREKEFEREIVRLGEQIEHLTIKFYEKI
jgi:predicted secreted Zn-dependent protease